MRPQEDRDIDDVGLCKTLILTLVIIAIGMTEKALYEIKQLFKK